MLLKLNIVAGPKEGETVPLPQGYSMSVGSSDQASYPIADDPGLAELHFRLEVSASGCFLRHLEPLKQTLVNGSPIGACLVRHGDKIQAGETVFTVELEGEGAGVRRDEDTPAGPTPAGVTAPGGAPAEKDVRTAPEIGADAELSDGAKAHLVAGQKPEAYFEKLRTERLLEDAVKFHALWLPKEKAVRWAWLCLKEMHTPELASEKSAYELAEKWIAEPSEELRAKAAEAAKLAAFEGAGAWLAGAVGFTGGSLAPPDEPELPPDPAMVGQYATTALLLVARAEGEKSAGKRFPRFLEIGEEVRKG